MPPYTEPPSPPPLKTVHAVTFYADDGKTVIWAALVPDAKSCRDAFDIAYASKCDAALLPVGVKRYVTSVGFDVNDDRVMDPAVHAHYSIVFDDANFVTAVISPHEWPGGHAVVP